MRPHRSFTLALLLTLVGLALPASSMAQQARSWVSGLGDDINPCTRTAPCRTLATAMSKTAARGEINAIDSGGFGPVTINKALTIDLRKHTGAISASQGSTAVIVNAAETDRVVIKGVSMNGFGTGAHGIRVLRARSVKAVDVDITGFVGNGIVVQNQNPLLRGVVADSNIHDNGGNGVLVAPAGSSAARVTVRNSNIDDNACGVTGARFGVDPSAIYSSNCGTLNGGTAASATVGLHTFGNGLTENTHFGLLSNGTTVRNRFGDNEIVGSDTGIAAINGGELISLRRNSVVGNHITNGAPTDTVEPI